MDGEGRRGRFLMEWDKLFQYLIGPLVVALSITWLNNRKEKNKNKENSKRQLDIIQIKLEDVMNVLREYNEHKRHCEETNKEINRIREQGLSIGELEELRNEYQTLMTERKYLEILESNKNNFNFASRDKLPILKERSTELASLPIDRINSSLHKECAEIQTLSQDITRLIKSSERAEELSEKILNSK